MSEGPPEGPALRRRPRRGRGMPPRGEAPPEQLPLGAVGDGPSEARPPAGSGESAAKVVVRRAGRETATPAHSEPVAATEPVEGQAYQGGFTSWPPRAVEPPGTSESGDARPDRPSSQRRPRRRGGRRENVHGAGRVDDSQHPSVPILASDQSSATVGATGLLRAERAVRSAEEADVVGEHLAAFAPEQIEDDGEMPAAAPAAAVEAGADAEVPKPARRRGAGRGAAAASATPPSPVDVNVVVPRGLGRKVDSKLIQRVVQLALQQEGWTRPATLDVVLVAEDEMRQINATRRGIDEATDVLSFPCLELRPGAGLAEDFFVLPPDASLHLGDVVIAFARVEAQALEGGHSQERELAFLTVHAVLHILGYDHDTEPRRRQMRRREEDVLAELGLRRNGQRGPEPAPAHAAPISRPSRGRRSTRVMELAPSRPAGGSELAPSPLEPSEP